MMMDWHRVDFDHVRTMTKNSLGATAAKHCKSLFIDVCLVLLRAKPALLIDTFRADSANLAKFVKETETYLQLTQTRLSLGSARILQIGDGDCMIIGEDRFGEIQTALSQKPAERDDFFASTRFVDVSAAHKSPRVLDNETRQRLLDWMALTFSNAEETQVDGLARTAPILNLIINSCGEGVSVPTLFGVLLGYPVVYYHHSNDVDNCLGLSRLKVISINCHSTLSSSASSAFQRKCLSFSVPNHMFSDAIVSSSRSMKERLQPHFQSVLLEVEDVSLTSVCL